MSDVNEEHEINQDIYLTARTYFFIDKEEICWPWFGGFTTGGIPRFKYKQISYKAHRVVLLHSLNLKQSPLWALHKNECKNKPNCVNPSHLYLGTAADNTRDCVNDGRHDCLDRKGEKHPMRRLKEEDVIFIRQEAARGVQHDHLAAIYNVSASNITMIVNRYRWKHI